jgi:mRNA interferase RelE/StbE
VNVFKIDYARSAEKELKALPSPVVIRIREAINALANDPHPPGSKKIKGEDRTFRIRIGDYRVLYEVHEKELLVLVVRVRHRKDAY